MCCTLGHVCECQPINPVKIRCHTCSKLIDSDDYEHIDSHINEAEGVICSQCHISIPNIPDWYGLCKSCLKDNARDKDS